MLVVCDKDQTVRGAAFRFATGGQLRLVFPAVGEINGLEQPYDLDCDDHMTDGDDCDDLHGRFRPAPRRSARIPTSTATASSSGATRANSR